MSSIRILFVAQYGFTTEAHLKIFERFSKDLRVDEILVLVPKNIKVDKVYNPKGFVKTSEIIFDKGKILPTSFIFSGINPFSIFKKIIKFKPDVIFVLNEAFSKDIFWTAFANTLIKIFFWWQRSAKIYFYGFENINKYYTDYRIKEKLAAQFIKKTVNYGIVCTDEALKVLNEVGWYPKTKKVWWGVDVDIFIREVSEERLQYLKRQLRIPENYYIIGYVGRFVEQKGIKELVEAFLKLDIKAVLLLIGDGKEQGWLYKKSEENKKIIILPFQTHNSLVLYYKLMDVLVLPSKTMSFWKEQYGRVLIEAMASGTKVVGSRSGSIPEIIGECGGIFRERDINDLKNILEKELNIKRDKRILLERTKLGSIENFVNQLLKFFQENL